MKSLFVAAQTNDRDAVIARLDAGVNVDSNYGDGWTALHASAWSGHETIVSVLLDRGATIDARCHGGRTALHMAALNDHHDLLVLLLNRGAGMDAQCGRGATALQRASGVGNLAVVLTLLARGASIDIKTYAGDGSQSALASAFKANEMKVFHALRALNASCSGLDFVGDYRGLAELTQIQCAIVSGSPGLLLRVLNESKDGQVSESRLADALVRAADQPDMLVALRAWSARRSAREALNVCECGLGRVP